MPRSSQWAEALVPVIYKWFDIGLKLRPSLIPYLYNVQGSTKAQEDHIGMGGVSPDAWLAYENTGEKSEIEWNKGYHTTFVHKEFPVTFTVERKLMDDDQYGIITQRARKLGISAAQRREIDAASVFNNSFSASFLGADGDPLVSDSHPKSPSNPATLDNKATAALDATAVGTNRVAMSKFEDDEGNPIAITPNLILVPPDLEDTAIEAVYSTLKPDTAENNLNPQVGRWIVQPWHYLTDVNNWWMIDTIWMKESLYWYNRAPLQFMLVHETTTELVYEAYMRYSYGWTDWRWVLGSEVA
jgi:phage major head subunit gpT-like protein